MLGAGFLFLPPSKGVTSARVERMLKHCLHPPVRKRGHFFNKTKKELLFLHSNQQQKKQIA